MTIPTDVWARMTVEITLGFDKSQSLIPWSDDIDAAWDRLKVEIEDLKAQGMTIDVVDE